MSYSTKIQGGTDETDIGNNSDALKVSPVPSDDLREEWDMMFYLLKEILGQLKMMNVHLQKGSGERLNDWDLE